MLTSEDVLKLIIEDRPTWIIEAEKEAKKYNTHFNGVNVGEYLSLVGGFENNNQLKARKQYATSNRFLFENLIRPIDKVFNATGGNNIYPKNKSKIIGVINNVRHGYSIKRWIQNIQANKYYTDPNGLILFEWDQKQTYPTIKSITGILNYSTSGRDVEWVIFNPEEKDGKKYYRVIDDSYDATYSCEGQNITIVEDRTYKNPFRKCPAIVNSDIVHFELDRKDSPFAPVIELADHYLRTGSVKNIYENYHGYPIFWAYGQPCKRCFGEGSIEEDGIIGKCPSCEGTGNSLHKDVTDVISLKPPTGDQPKIAPDIAGYVQPDLETWREMRTELDSLWQMIHFTTWGTSYQRDQETATASFIDAQPVNERLFKFSESFEDLEQKMTELICLFYLKSTNDISINYGKRFMIESPDTIWNKYINAKQKGAPKTSLDYLLTQFYQSEYSNDMENLVTVVKLIKLEPFIHLTEKEVKDAGVTGIDLTAKLYFHEWVKLLESGYVFMTDITKLKNEFDLYVQNKHAELEPVEVAELDKEIINEDVNINNKQDEKV